MILLLRFHDTQALTVMYVITYTTKDVADKGALKGNYTRFPKSTNIAHLLTTI